VKKPKSKSPVNLAGYERLAQRVLPKPIFDHAAGGAEDVFAWFHIFFET
jgi:hypothetical protein